MAIKTIKQYRFKEVMNIPLIWKLPHQFQIDEDFDKNSKIIENSLRARLPGILPHSHSLHGSRHEKMVGFLSKARLGFLSLDVF